MLTFNTMHLDEGDTLILTMHEDIDFNTVSQIQKVFHETFPTNTILTLPDGVVDNITIIKEGAEDASENIFLETLQISV